MKVQLTQNGVPFGRVMNREIAYLYLEQTRHVLVGLGWVMVNHES